MPGDWRNLVAEITKYYGWGPRDAWSLTWSEIQWWGSQALRMERKISAKQTESNGE